MMPFDTAATLGCALLAVVGVLIATYAIKPPWGVTIKNRPLVVIIGGVIAIVSILGVVFIPN